MSERIRHGGSRGGWQKPTAKPLPASSHSLGLPEKPHRGLPGVVFVARCPEHGLHGCREACFECGVPVEQIPMIEVGASEHRDDCFDAEELMQWASRYGHPEGWAKLAQQNHARAERLEAKLAALQREEQQ